MGHFLPGYLEMWFLFLQVLMTYWNMNEFEVRAARFQYQVPANQVYVDCLQDFTKRICPITRLESLTTDQGGRRDEGAAKEVARHRRIRRDPRLPRLLGPRPPGIPD